MSAERVGKESGPYENTEAITTDKEVRRSGRRNRFFGSGLFDTMIKQKSRGAVQQVLSSVPALRCAKGESLFVRCLKQARSKCKNND